MHFTKTRDVTLAGFAADDPPNVTPPDDPEVFSAKLKGHSLYVRFLDGSDVEIPGASADFVTWVLDVGSGLWVGHGDELGALSSRMRTSKVTGKLWVQLLAVYDISTAVKIQVWMTDRDAV